jgi:hypothetical protein
MPAGVHRQPRYTLRTSLLPELERAAREEGVTLAHLIVRACRAELARIEADAARKAGGL